MKYAVVSAAIVLAIGAGWISAALVQGQEAGKVTPTATAPAPAAPLSTEPPAPVAKVRTETPVAPPTAQAPSLITPPTPLPDVVIPPIPEVDKARPFQPGPPPVRKIKPDVLEEGKHLFNREGRMEMDPMGRPAFIFDSGDKPMRILENSWRQMMEGKTDRGAKEAKWRVSGTVMVYEGSNYLLLTSAVHLLPEDENP
jgi:hypothetical protein